jgi:SAM-dependent methyltransferase
MSLLGRLKGKGVKTRLLHPHDELWDRRLGIRTAGWTPSRGDYDDPFRKVEYRPTPYAVLLRMLRRVGVGRGDVVVDLGAGLGRAVFLASWLGAKRAVGVEIDGALVEKARANLARSRLAGRTIEFVQSPAEAYPQDDTTVIFMFNPFGVGIMHMVVERITRTLEQRPRELRIAYLNPLAASALDASPRLARLDQWVEERVGPEFLLRWKRAAGWGATFWRAADPASVAPPSGDAAEALQALRSGTQGR